MSEKIKIKLRDADTIKSFLSTVRGFVSDVDLITERAQIDAKSLLGIFTLNLSDDTYVRMISDDSEEIDHFNAAMEEFK